VLKKLVYLLLCAAVLSNTTVFDGQAYALPEQDNQFDMHTEQAQSGSVKAEIEPTAPAEPSGEIAAEEATIEPEPENAAGADACDEALKWYNDGLNLSDDSAREADYYQRAIELCPDFSAAHYRLGEVYKSRGEYESALKEFDQAKKWSLLNEPGLDQRGNRSLLVDQFIKQGEIYRMQGRYDLAAGQFERALRINPDSRVAMNQLQYVNKMSGRYDNLVLPLLQKISSPIFTRTPGMTLPRGIFSAGFLVRWWEQEATLTQDMFIEEIPDLGRSLPFKRKTDVLQWVLDLRYGLTDNISIGLFPRWSIIWANMSLDSSARDKASGLGDTIVMAKFQFWATRKTRISLYHLYSIPTGDEDKKAGRFGAKIPLGSGSFNFTPGIAITTEKEYLEAPLAIHSNISYRFTNGEVIGDELRCDLAITYPFSPDINSTMELNYRWRDTFIHPQTFITNRGSPGGAMLFDATVKEKSGYALFLSPGFQFTFPKDIRLNVGVQIPLIKPEGGWAEKFVVNFGLKGFWDWW
jgi:Putative MetA-pathway of phenol degradation/Tetratricopeptide repeat